MFPLKGIREHVTNKMDEIMVLRKYRDVSGMLIIQETERNDRQKGQNGEEPLKKITVQHIPQNGVWIFENEFGHQDEAKSAFTSGGKKVEKTIIYHKDNRLYLFMVEMKRTISPSKMRTDVVKKYEGCLDTLSVFLAAHLDFPSLVDTNIYPIGICCYNYYDDPRPNDNNDPVRVERKIRDMHNNNQSEVLLKIEPISLNSMVIPICFCKNPFNPASNSFDIDLENILTRITRISSTL